MDSVQSSTPIPFKSKKIMRDPVSKSDSKPDSKSLNLMFTKTPDKQLSAAPLRRGRNRGVAFSLKEIRSAAQETPKPPTSKIKSAKRQILSRPIESPVPKPKNDGDRSMQLPEKYEMLARFFDGLDSTIRLSRLRGSITNFSRISPQIERLTDRRVLHSHLAQMKFILPEAIEIKKVVTFDERTSCTKPDLHVTINVDAIESGQNSKVETKNMSLRKLFRVRLADFHEAHPEGDEIPEHMLPEPFNHSQNYQKLNIQTVNRSTNAPATSVPVLQNQAISVSTIKFGKSYEEGKLESSVVESSVSASKRQDLAVASHLPSSFRKPFFSKVSFKKDEKVDNISSNDSVQPSLLTIPQASNEKHNSIGNSSPDSPVKLQTTSLTAMVNKDSSTKYGSIPSTPASVTSALENPASIPAKRASTPAKHASTPVKLASTPAKRASTPVKLASTPVKLASTPVKLASTPVKLASTPVKLASTTSELASTPAKLASTSVELASTPARLMTATPTLKQQKRCYMSPDDEITNSSNKLIRRPRCVRSMKNDFLAEDKNTDDTTEGKVENEVSNKRGGSIDDDILNFLPESLLQSIKEKERKAMEERDPAISQAKRRRQMICCLPKLFNSVRFLFQSIRRSVITKDELMHKLIISHSDIVDRREIEEQLDLLLELVPEWISEKPAIAGGMLIRINTMASVETMHARLKEAK